MEEKDGAGAQLFALAVYAALIAIPSWLVWQLSGSGRGGAAIGGLILALLLLNDWAGGRGLNRRLRDRARDESAPYDEPPDRPLSRWQ